MHQIRIRCFSIMQGQVYLYNLEIMSSKETFHSRFRFRTQKRLNIKNKKHRLEINGHSVILMPRLPEQDICDSEWLVMEAGAFKSEDEAWEFGKILKTSCEVSSVSTRLGLDSGEKLLTSRSIKGSFTKSFKECIQKETGIPYINDIHGIDVYQYNPNSQFISMDMTIRSILVPPDPFLNNINHLFDVVNNIPEKISNIVLFLNSVLMISDPTAQAICSFAIVESLGQNERWSTNQKNLINKLIDNAMRNKICSETDRMEVAEAINKMHRISLRQSVLRLLESYELDHLKRPWDDLYSKRSALVHGLDLQNINCFELGLISVKYASNFKLRNI